MLFELHVALYMWLRSWQGTYSLHCRLARVGSMVQPSQYNCLRRCIPVVETMQIVSVASGGSWAPVLAGISVSQPVFSICVPCQSAHVGVGVYLLGSCLCSYCWCLGTAHSWTWTWWRNSRWFLAPQKWCPPDAVGPMIPEVTPMFLQKCQRMDR